MSVNQNSTLSGGKENKSASFNDKRTSGRPSAFVEVQLKGRTALALNTDNAHQKFVVIAGSEPPKGN